MPHHAYPPVGYPARPRKRNPWPWIILGCALLIAVFVLVILPATASMRH
jgi:hypothetical protein